MDEQELRAELRKRGLGKRMDEIDGLIARHEELRQSAIKTGDIETYKQFKETEAALNKKSAAMYTLVRAEGVKYDEEQEQAQQTGQQPPAPTQTPAPVADIKTLEERADINPSPENKTALMTARLKERGGISGGNLNGWTKEAIESKKASEQALREKYYMANMELTQKRVSELEKAASTKEDPLDQVAIQATIKNLKRQELLRQEVMNG